MSPLIAHTCSVISGVPTILARKMLGGANSLVGRIVTSEQGATTAAADGANLVLLMVRALTLALSKGASF